MADNAFSHIFAWLGWAYIPNYATSFLQSLYYKLTIPVGQTPPQPGTPQFAKHYRRIRALVLCLYLTYTLLQALYDIKLAGDFFTFLSVTPASTDREIKSRFRRLAAKYHPDKLQQPSPTTAGDSNTDARFLTLKLAQDTLLSPTLRFAYTRFGPGVATISLPDDKRPTIQTYVMSGIRHNLLPGYAMNLVSLVGLNYFFLPKSGSYWRYLILFTVFTIELYLLTHTDNVLTSSSTTTNAASTTSASTPLSFQSYTTHFLSTLFLTLPRSLYAAVQTRTKLSSILPPHLLPYQILSILRTLSISLNIFISQLGPLISPSAASPLSSQSSSSSSSSGDLTTAKILTDLNETLSHLSALANRTDTEATGLLQLQLAPYKRGEPGGGMDGDQSAAVLRERLRGRMCEGVVFGALKARPEVKEAIEAAIRRKGRG